MMLANGILLLLLFFFAGRTAIAQEAAADEGLAEMKKLASMIGTWEGTASIQMGPTKTAATSSEKVEYRLGGRVIVVEGLHHAQENPDQVVHHALGVISWNAAEQQYRFRTWLHDGRQGDHVMKLVDPNTIQWFLNSPQGEVRYTIRIADGKWNETGEISRGGENWQPFFEMDLHSAAAAPADASGR
jgi:hypothetical protein